MLRILHVAPYGESAWGYGGIPRVVGPLSHGLARRGHHVTICTSDASDRTARLPSRGSRFKPWTAAASPDGLVWRIFPNLSNRLAYHQQAFLPIGLRQYLHRHAGDFDVAH